MTIKFEGVYYGVLGNNFRYYNTMIDNLQFNRRDFLKISAAGALAFTLAELNLDRALAKTDYPEAFIVVPEDTDYLTAFSERLELPVDTLQPICIQAGAEKFNFLEVPPVTNSDGSGEPERLFMYIRRNSTRSGADTSRWVELHKATGNVAGQDIVTWIYTNNEPKPRLNKSDKKNVPVEEVIISFPVLTPEQWASTLPADQFNQAMFFWPDSDSAWRVSPIMGYDRAKDGQFIIPLHKNNENFGMSKVLLMPIPYEKEIIYSQVDINSMSSAEILKAGPELDGHRKWRAAGKFVMYVDESTDEVTKAYDMITGEYKDILEFPITSPENFKKSFVSEDQLKNGDYFLWLQKIAYKLEPNPNRRKDIRMEVWDNMILPDHNSAPNFEKGGEFFIRDVTAAYSSKDVGADVPVEYMVIPLFMCDPQSGEFFPIIVVHSAYQPKDVPPNWSQKKANQIYMSDGVVRWRKDMKVTPIRPNANLELQRANAEDPLVADTFKLYPREYWDEQIKNFTEASDYSALSKPGAVFLTMIGSWRFPVVK